LQRCRGVEVGAERVFQLGEGAGDTTAGHPAGEFADVGAPAAGAHLQATQTIGHVVIDEPAHAGQLPGRREVVDDAHVRVGGVSVPVEQQLGVLHDGSDHPDLDGLERLARRTDPAVAAAWRAGRRRNSGREERLACVEHLRGEHGEPSGDDLLHLVRSSSHRRRGGDQGRSDRPLRTRSRAHRVDDGLEQTDHRAQRIADEVQFVLDDEIWGT
jgi:hypothetical protein